jgi:hypothetical protein
VDGWVNQWSAIVPGFLSLAPVKAAWAEPSQNTRTSRSGQLEPVRTERVDRGRRLQLAFAPAFATLWGDFDGQTYFDNGLSAFLAPEVKPGAGFAITLSALWGGGKLNGPTGFGWGAEVSYSQTFHGSRSSSQAFEGDGQRGPALRVDGSTGATQLRELSWRLR